MNELHGWSESACFRRLGFHSVIQKLTYSENGRLKQIQF